MVDVICPPLSISSIVVSLWLAGCLAKSTLIGWREYYGGGGVGVDRHLCGAQQTRAFDPMLLTKICHREAYEYRAVSCFCNPSADSEKRTRSSANNRYTISKVSTAIPWSWSNDADMSCENSVNSLGLSIPPCRTPYSLFNMSLIRESHFTRHFRKHTFYYVQQIAVYSPVQ